MSENVNEQIVMLIATALISGLLVPPIAKIIDNVIQRNSDVKKQFRERQIELLDRLTKTIWTWRFLAKEVPYHGFQKTKSEHSKKIYPDAVKKYHEEIWNLLIEIKRIKSEVLVWFSVAKADEVEKLYNEIRERDKEIEKLIIKNETGEDCSAEFLTLSNGFSKNVSPLIDDCIKRIAEAMR